MQKQWLVENSTTSVCSTRIGLHDHNIDSRPLTRWDTRTQPVKNTTTNRRHLSLNPLKPLNSRHISVKYLRCTTTKDRVQVQVFAGIREQPLRLAKRGKGSLSQEPRVANSGRSDITNTCSSAGLHNPQQAIEAHTTAMETVRVFLHTCTVPRRDIVTS